MYAMNRSLRYFCVLWQEIFSSPAIYGAIILFVLLCAFGDAAEIEGTEYSVLEIFSDLALYRKAANSVQCSSYILTLSYDESPWFVVAASIITAFPGFLVYEQNSGKIQMQILVRTNIRRYIEGLFYAIFFSGMLIAASGILIYSIIIKLTFPSFENFNDEVMSEIYGKTEWSRFMPLFRKAVNCCLMCGIFPVISVICRHIFRDRFFSFTFPMMLEYISLKFSILYSSWLYADTERSGNRFLKFLYLMLPSNCMRHFSYWENSMQLPFACFFAVFAICTLTLYFIFKRLIRRYIGDC